LNTKKILILDYSVSKIEAPAIRRWMPQEAEVKSLFIDTEESFPEHLSREGFTHVIHSGSELTITENAPFTRRAVDFIKTVRDQGVPQMGICYGHQLISRALVGKDAVRRNPNGFEVGWVSVKFSERATNLFGVKESEVVWQHHFDEVIELPEDSELLGTNGHTKIQSFINVEQNIFGTQFHPEFDKEAGDEIYIKDSKLLKAHNYSVEEIVKGSPSIDAGRVFFDFFLEKMPNTASA